MLIPAPFLVALSLTTLAAALPASASATPLLSTPLADYSREDLGGCLEAAQLTALQQVVLYCPGAAGFEVIMTTAKKSESLALKKGGRTFDISFGNTPTNKTPVAFNLGFSGAAGVQDLRLLWKIEFTKNPQPLLESQLQGLLVPISFTTVGAMPGEFTVSRYWAVVRVSETEGHACVVQYVQNTGQDTERANAEQLVEAALNRSCLN